MKIVILDAYTSNPGDLSWERFEKLGDFTAYDYTAPDQTLERMKDADIVITNKTVITKEIIDASPKLRYIGVLATGYNVIDVEAARKRDIPCFCAV